MDTAEGADAAWRKASRSSGDGQCVEVARLDHDVIAVRDSKASNGKVLVFTTAEWAAFVGGLKDGEFDLG